MSIRLQSIIKGLVLVLAAVFIYLPAMRSDFIWDDDTFLYQNASIDNVALPGTSVVLTPSLTDREPYTVISVFTGM